ncbi:MAG: septum formation inhibitor MinC [Acidocella sp. 20-61-6]|nr:MAG: septum formation inhibitor MinC [Acidocella sp. 20-61-6]
MTTESLSLPQLAIRGRSFIALIVSPELPLGEWFAALDQQMARSAGFFANRPVVVNLAVALGAGEALEDVLEALDARNLSVIGVEGIDPALLEGTRWARLQRLSLGRDMSHDGKTDRLITIPDDPHPSAAEPAAEPAPRPATASLLLDRPVRSGQSIFFEDGDITIIGSVASGAEVIAGGSIHIYGTLRGRAIAGLKTGAAARIFCQKLAAELVAIDGLYFVSEHWGEGLLGRAVQVCLEQGVLKVLPLDH